MEHRERLAAALLNRRNELDLTQDEVAGAAGLSPQTYGKAERGTAKVAPRTLRKIDRALEWPHGTARAILAGDELSVTSLPLVGTNGHTPSRTGEAVARLLGGTGSVTDAEAREIVRQMTSAERAQIQAWLDEAGDQ